jgi:5-methylcytosine-specific restriction endonuclease McrA
MGGATNENNLVMLCPTCHKAADKNVIQRGKIFGGKYSINDIEPEQRRS